MIHIEEITLREIRMPLKEPFVISSGVQSVRRILLVELQDADGFSGWSECVAQETPNYSPETIDTAWHAIREWLAPELRNPPPGSARSVSERLDAHVRGHEMAKAALEMACWHLEAERKQTSLAKLLGGTRAEVPVGISIGIQDDPATLVEKVRRYRTAGYLKFKVKIKPGSDRAYLGAVRNAFGDDLPLAADANASYRTIDSDLLTSLDEFGLIMLEQPLQHDDLLRHARLQAQIRTPICLDESITSVERAEDMIELEAGRVVNIKPGRVGGFAKAIAIHDLCARHGMPVWCGGMLESGIGRAHNVALASLPNFSIPGDLSPSNRYWERDIVEPEWTMSQEGMVRVPVDETGLGVRLDMERIDELTHRREVVPIW